MTSTTHTTTRDRSKFAPMLAQEPHAHSIARHFKSAFRALLVVSAIATGIGLFFFREQVYLAAIPIPILLFGLIGVDMLERKSRAAKLRSRDQSGLSAEEIELDEEAVSMALILKLLGVFALAAIIVAATFFDWQIVGLSAAVLFMMAILIGLPYWPLFVAEAREAEHEKLTSKK